MISVDRDAVICDMAETYHIYDFHTLPVQTFATLAVGLRGDSRIKMRIQEMTHISPVFSLVSIADTLSQLAHALVGKEGSPPPALLSDIMNGKQSHKESEGFSSIEEFEAVRKRIFIG